MKRVMTFVIAAALVAALAPVGAAGPKGQKETGTVLLAGPGPNGEVTGGCWTGWARRAWIFSGGATAGPFGSMFEIDKKTWGGKFKLDVVSGVQGDEDLDITFYIETGQIDPTDPAQQAGIIEGGTYLTRQAGGEKGLVPLKSKVALVCLGVGTGANAEWSYTATPPVKKKKRK